MANQGAKKRKEENTRHMAKILRLIIACNVMYVLLRMLIFHSTITWKHWVGLVLTSVAYVMPYQQLSAMAKPTYGDDGGLLDGGFDMGTGGICGYLHDIIYITSFVQVMSNHVGKILVHVLGGQGYEVRLSVCNTDTVISFLDTVQIPAFAAYKSFGFILEDFFHRVRSEGVVDDKKTRRKREKMEKKASRTKFVRSRNR